MPDGYIYNVNIDSLNVKNMKNMYVRVPNHEKRMNKNPEIMNKRI